MHQQGVSVRKISAASGVARQTVWKFIDGEKPTAVSATEPWHSGLNWQEIAQQAARGVTVKQLHAEYAPEVKYGRFWRQLRAASPVAPEVTLRLVHTPGERVEIDYADGIGVVDARTGEDKKTHLFVGTLPFSSYVFGEFAFSQKRTFFIESHEMNRPGMTGGSTFWKGGAMGRRSKSPTELRERAVRLVIEHRHEHESEWAPIQSIAAKVGCPGETLRVRLRQAERDAGQREG
jgi:hypothetical protein